MLDFIIKTASFTEKNKETKDKKAAKDQPEEKSSKSVLQQKLSKLAIQIGYAGKIVLY